MRTCLLTPFNDRSLLLASSNAQSFTFALAQLRFIYFCFFSFAVLLVLLKQKDTCGCCFWVDGLHRWSFWLELNALSRAAFTLYTARCFVNHDVIYRLADASRIAKLSCIPTIVAFQAHRPSPLFALLARIIFPFPTGVKRPGCWCFILLRISPRLPYSLVNNVGARKQARSLITIVFFSIERARNPSLIPRPQPIANPFFFIPPCRVFIIYFSSVCLSSVF